MGRLGYDIGGAENPLHQMSLTILDNMDRKEAEKFWPRGNKKGYDYVKVDVNKGMWANGLPPRQFVYCSRLLRFVTGVGPMPEAPILDRECFSSFTSQIARLVAPGGVLVMYDYSHLVLHAAIPFKHWQQVTQSWIVGVPEQIEPPDGNWPGESRIAIVRLPN